jgi:hypothetical protein
LPVTSISSTVFLLKLMDFLPPGPQFKVGKRQ